MLIKKSDVITAILATVIGAFGGFAMYFPEIQRNAFPSFADVEWQAGTIDENVLKDAASFEQMLALTPPQPDAPYGEWKRFLAQLDQVEMGKRYSNQGVTTPLLGWYAYIAKHHPAAIYDLIENHGVNASLFNHLIQFGFLEEWPDKLKNLDSILLSSHEALLAFSISRGEKEAQRYVADLILGYADNNSDSDAKHNQKSVEIKLKNIVFAMNAMNESEKQQVIPLLKSGIFNFDPRSVEYLLHLENIDRGDLLTLIRMYAYPSRSMSSYMTTGALLGAEDYVMNMAGDAHDNSKQPTNFYCSACGLALATDGLIGQELIKAKQANQLLVKQAKNGEFILSKSTK